MKDRIMEDVFDLTGLPPQGWMHAIFDGGPYAEDVGRCVPGPPAPATIKVPMSDGRQHVYRLSVVGSWSAPADPIAISTTPALPLCRRYRAGTSMAAQPGRRMTTRHEPNRWNRRSSHAAPALGMQ